MSCADDTSILKVSVFDEQLQVLRLTEQQQSAPSHRGSNHFAIQREHVCRWIWAHEVDASRFWLVPCYRVSPREDDAVPFLSIHLEMR